MKKHSYFACVICLCLAVLFGTAQTVSAATWPQVADAGSLQSGSAIVMDLDTGTILYGKNIDERKYPASITKVMTCMLALENSDLTEVVTFSEDAVFKTDGSSIARDVGEQMTMEECLYGMMLASANECAYAIAEHVAGSLDAFIDMMNARAEELGCSNTHFVTPNGLHDDNHYVSARDMALIAQAAYENETFRTIVGTKTYQIPPTNKHEEITYMTNSHGMLLATKVDGYVYPYALGGKTGFTDEAGNTLVTYASKDGVNLVCVVLDSANPGHYEDTTTLLNACFANFEAGSIAQYEGTLSQTDSFFHGLSVDFMGGELPVLSVDNAATYVLPTGVGLDAANRVLLRSDEKDALGVAGYFYAGHKVGEMAIYLNAPDMSGSILPSDYAAPDPETDKNLITIEMLYLLGACALIALLITPVCLLLRRSDD